MATHPAGKPGAMRQFYEDVAGRTLDRNTRRGIRYRNESIRRRLGPPGRILEIGPGEGWLVESALRAGHAVVTADLSRRWLSRLPDAGHERLLRVQGDALSLPFAGGIFDRVVAAEVIEHLPDPLATLREARRILKPGGRFLASVPYRESLRFLRCPHCAGEFEPNGHLHTFDENSFSALFREAGLEPGYQLVAPTRFSREIWRRFDWPPLLPWLHALDRLTLASQRVSDTWILLEGTPVA
ncbi:MAG: class I SAM-dependent methyltransferase [Candidatus Eisenbacteria bacterium]|nr:class I SAM-dependent methyltransferase [Candidatus Eisenbacteria bacterium]